jgi:hypothetical protein
MRRFKHRLLFAALLAVASILAIPATVTQGIGRLRAAFTG